MEQKHLIHALHLPMPLAFFSGCLAAGTLELPSQTCMIPQLGDQEQVDSFLYSVEYKVIYGYHFLKILEPLGDLDHNLLLNLCYSMAYYGCLVHV